jgi:hypothetical protein
MHGISAISRSLCHVGHRLGLPGSCSGPVGCHSIHLKHTLSLSSDYSGHTRVNFSSLTREPLSFLDCTKRILPHAALGHISRLATWKAYSSELNGLSDGQEEAAKVAILEKVMKGRQPTDLMLRCTYLLSL